MVDAAEPGQDQSPVTEAELLDFVAGRASKESQKRIIEDWERDGSFTANWFSTFSKALDNPFDTVFGDFSPKSA